MIIFSYTGSACQYFDNLKKRFSKKKHSLLRAWKNSGEGSNEAVLAESALREYEFLAWLRPFLRNKRGKWEIEESYGDEDYCGDGSDGREEGGDTSSFQYLRYEYAMMEDSNSNEATKEQNGGNKDGSGVTVVVYEGLDDATKTASITNNDIKNTSNTVAMPSLEEGGPPTFVMSDIKSLKRKSLPSPVGALACERPAKQAFYHPTSSPLVAIVPKTPGMIMVNNQQANKVTVNNTVNSHRNQQHQQQNHHSTTATTTNSSSTNQQQTYCRNQTRENETRFGEMITHELEKLPAILRIQAKNEMTNVLFRYQLQHETQNMANQQANQQ